MRCYTELEAVARLARELDRDDVPAFLGALEEIRTIALCRLLAPPVPSPADEWLDVREASARLRCSPSFLYRNSGRLQAKRIGRSLRFSSTALDSFLKKSSR
jgi:excisionase family DNA binding protein